MNSLWTQVQSIVDKLEAEERESAQLALRPRPAWPGDDLVQLRPLPAPPPWTPGYQPPNLVSRHASPGTDAPMGLLQPGSYEAAMATAARAGQGPVTAPQAASPMEHMTVTGQRLPPTTPTGATVNGRDVSYSHPDGTRETWTGGTLAWRANNPGNLEYNSYSRRHGAIGGPINGRAIFPDPETGRAAMDTLLKSPGYQGKTVDEFVTRYAGSDNPDLNRYLPFVRDRVGVPGTTPAQQLTPEQWDSMMRALRLFENTTAGDIAVQPLSPRR